jgi:hypothetical protein
MNLDDVQPESATTRTASEVTMACCSPALVNRCLRSYAWAAVPRPRP